MKLSTLLLVLTVIWTIGCSAANSTIEKVIVNKLDQDIVIKRGEVVKVELPAPDTALDFELSCNGQNIIYHKKEGLIVGYISESYFSNMTPYTCEYIFSKEVLGENNIYKVANIVVEDRQFQSETLKVDPKTITLSKKNLERVTKEFEITSKIYSNSSKQPLFDKPFTMPLSSKITSPFGSQRVYNNEKKSQHLGIDFRATSGVPIPASNSGKVVLAQDLFYTGKTVIIDHGLNIFSTYAHMSKLNVKKDDLVLRKKIIGYSGATGRSTGPHLHWGVKINNNYIDGVSLVKTTSN